MIAEPESSTPAPIASPQSILAGAVLGWLATPVANVVTFLVLTASAPRKDEGIRRVVTWPWTPYAVAAHLIPVALVWLLAMCLFRDWRLRVAALLAAATAEWVLFEILGANLLRRDYIGKF